MVLVSQDPLMNTNPFLAEIVPSTGPLCLLTSSLSLGMYDVCAQSQPLFSIRQPLMCGASTSSNPFCVILYEQGLRFVESNLLRIIYEARNAHPHHTAGASRISLAIRGFDECSD